MDMQSFVASKDTTVDHIASYELRLADQPTISD